MTEQDQQFVQQCAELNRTLLAAQDVKEVVSEETCYMALVIEKNMQLNDVGDALLFAAALNVLNTYVKQSKENKKQVGYSFKNKTDLLAKFLNEHPTELMQIEIQRDNDMPLMLVDICSLQFSFHNVQTTENNQRYAAKDLNHPALAWDGIRKQNCANSVFDYAYNSQWRRSNLMMDESDFAAGMAAMLDAYHAGTKGIEDAKQAQFTNYKKEEKAEEAEEAEETTGVYVQEDAKTYPFRSQISSTLYTDTMGHFLDVLSKRKLVDHVAKVYQEGYGYPIASLEKESLKYALECFASLLYEYGYNAESAIRVDCIHISDRNTFVLLLSSKGENGMNHTSAVTLFDSAAMDFMDEQKIKSREDEDKVSAILMKVTRLTVSYLDRLAMHDVNLYSNESCIFCYDLPASSELDSVLESTEEAIGTKSVFLAEDRKSLYECIKASVMGRNGLEVSSVLASSDSLSSQKVSDSLLGEQDYILNQAIAHIREGAAFITFVSGGSNTGKSELADSLLSAIAECGIKAAIVSNEQEAANLPNDVKAVVYYKYIPEENDHSASPFRFIIYNPYLLTEEEMDALETLRDAQQSTKTYFYSLTKTLGFSDNGGGINWLLYHFALAPNNGLLWDMDLYSIRLVDSSRDFTETEGITNVVVAKGISYNPSTKEISSTRSEQIALYEALFTGTNGVNLLIEDVELKKYIKDSLEAFDQSKLHKALKICKDNPEQCEKLLQESLGNTATANQYTELLIRYLEPQNWLKLTDPSREWLVSSMYSFKTLEQCDPTMDFAGIVLQISKVFETEILLRLSDEYLAYLRAKYGEDEYKDHVPYKLTKQNKDGSVRIVSSHDLTMGDIPSIMGMDKRGKVCYEKEYEQFLVYCADELLISPENAESDLPELCRVSDHVRASFRNKAAHKDAIDYVLARECVDYSITVDNKLGWVMGLFAK